MIITKVQCIAYGFVAILIIIGAIILGIFTTGLPIWACLLLPFPSYVFLGIMLYAYFYKLQDSN